MAPEVAASLSLMLAISGISSILEIALKEYPRREVLLRGALTSRAVGRLTPLALLPIVWIEELVKLLLVAPVMGDT